MRKDHRFGLRNILAGVLSAAMVLSSFPATVLATDETVFEEVAATEVPELTSVEEDYAVEQVLGGYDADPAYTDEEALPDEDSLFEDDENDSGFVEDAIGFYLDAETDSVSVKVSAEDGILPDGTELTAEEPDQEILDQLNAEVPGLLGEDREMTGLAAVALSFADADGNAFYPDGEVTVELAAKELNVADRYDLVLLDKAAEGEEAPATVLADPKKIKGDVTTEAEFSGSDIYVCAIAASDPAEAAFEEDAFPAEEEEVSLAAAEEEIVEEGLEAAAVPEAVTAEGQRNFFYTNFEAQLTGTNIKVSASNLFVRPRSTMTAEYISEEEYVDDLSAQNYGKVLVGTRLIKLTFRDAKGKAFSPIGLTISIEADVMAEAESYVLYGVNGSSVRRTGMSKKPEFSFYTSYADTFILAGLMSDGALRVEGKKKGSNTVFSVDKEDVDVTVTAPKGAFYGAVSMELWAVDEGEVRTALENIEGIGDVAAYDISFHADSPEEIEPNKDVTVTINTDTAVDENCRVFHIKDDGDAEEVEIIDFTDKGVSFKAKEFSTYVLTWGTGEDEASATIHWGYLDGTTFTELEEGSTVTLDTTASTVSLENTYDGYKYVSALYLKDSEAESVDISPARLVKTDNGWEINTVTVAEGGATTTQTVPVADGSEILVIYVRQITPSPSGDNNVNVPNPITEKHVQNNGDGTYTITLDITGQQLTQTTQTGANVLLVVDTTSSMRYGIKDGQVSATNPERFEVARTAILKLIDTLKCDVNDVDLALVEFNRTASTSYSWTPHGQYMTIRNYVNSSDFKRLDYNFNTAGTNWMAGLAEAQTVLESRDSDDTYIIFLTDGEPNAYSYQRWSHGHYVWDVRDWQSAATAISYAQPIAQAINNLPKTHLYGVFCGNDSGYSNLNDMITEVGGVETINGTDEATLVSAFENIANTVVNNLNASNAVVDDGVPSLAGISANVIGQPGGYEYSIKRPDDNDFSPWNGAPGAIYSQDNGVTWDLSSVGALPAGTTFRIEFTVWPSQEAYDLIADLNNGVKDYETDLTPAEKAAVTGSKKEGYTLVTNTHLNTTYTFQNQEYSDSPTELEKEAMPLPTKKINLKKLWPDNLLDGYKVEYRDANGVIQTTDKVILTITKDGAHYIDREVSQATDWKDNDIYISCGNMTVHEDPESHEDVVTINSPGHDYTVTEPEGYSYLWDLVTDVYHPMVINGVDTMLIYDEHAKDTDVDNITYFKIGNKIYKKDNSNASTLEGHNYRRSNLNLMKKVSTEGGKDDYFTFKARVKDANSFDGKVWFSAIKVNLDANGNPVPNPNGDITGDTVMDSDWVISGALPEIKNDSPTGYWYADNDSVITFKIKKDWNVRFLNLYHGSTFSFEETNMTQYYQFEGIEAKAQYPFMDSVHNTGTSWYSINPDVDNPNPKLIKGTIPEPNNRYYVTYTNKFEAFYIYHSSVKEDGGVETIPMHGEGIYDENGKFNLWARVKPGTLYGGYYLDYEGKGSYKDGVNEKKDGIAYNGVNATWGTAQTENGKAMTPEAGVTYYIKEVPVCYLQNYIHYTYMLNEPNELTGFYLISAIDDRKYSEIGFILSEVKKTNKDTTDKVKIVSKVTFRQPSGDTVLTPDTCFSSKGDKNGNIRVNPVPADERETKANRLTYYDTFATKQFFKKNFSYTMLPYWITHDGIEVHGTSTRTVSFDDVETLTLSDVHVTDTGNIFVEAGE